MTILWQNGTGDPKRVGGDDWAKDEDFVEIVEQINRRRLLEYRAADAALDDPFDPALWMRAPSVSALRYEFTGNNLVHPPVGGLGGQPPTPSYMRWLWPEADADEDKPITLASPPPEGEVNFFAKMNGTGSWTDAIAAGPGCGPCTSTSFAGPARRSGGGAGRCRSTSRPGSSTTSSIPSWTTRPGSGG